MNRGKDMENEETILKNKTTIGEISKPDSINTKKEG